MLIIYVITVVFVYVIYIVVKLKIEEWFGRIRMDEFNSEENNLSDNESEMHNSTMIGEECAVEISDDSLEDTVENVKPSTNNLLQFQKSTDSISSDSDVEEVLFMPKSKLKDNGSMFRWGRKSTHLKQNINVEHSDLDSDNDRNQQVKKSKMSHETKLKPSTSKEDAAGPKVALNYERIISGITVKLPVKPYSCQIAVMHNLIQGCLKGVNCLLESPTGTGKTLALLCAALAWHDYFSEEVRKQLAKVQDGSGDWMEPGMSSNRCEETKKLKIPKIYYGTRTHKQIEQVTRELKKTMYRHKKMTILSSREHTCIQQSNRNKTELCNELLDPQKHKGCPFYNENNKKVLNNFHAVEMRGLGPVWDIEDLVAIGKESGLCPYFAARNLMDFADIIFCPYNYIIDPDIRSSLQMDLKDQVIILDEAHNIEEICRDVASHDFQDEYVVAAANECKDIANVKTSDTFTYKTLESYLLKFVEFLKDATLEKVNNHADDLSSPYWNGAELLELFNMHGIGESKYQSFVNSCTSAIEDFNKVKEESRMQQGKHSMSVISPSTRVLLEHLMYAMKMISSPQYRDDFRACVTETAVKNFRHVPDDTWSSGKNNRTRVLKLLCMNSGVIFEPLAKSARCIILASGTLTPTTSFKSELNTEFAHVLNAGHVIPKEQVYATCVSKGPNGISLRATYNNVNSWAFQDELGNVLVDVCETVPHGVLCFFSSYHMMNNQLERWRKTSIWRKISRIKQVFIEPRYGGDLKDIMDEYREVIKDTSAGPSGGINGALFLAVFRGKVAEGIDFRDDEARCVVTVGIPYAVRKDPVIDMKFKYNDKNTGRRLLKGSDWYTVQAFRALNQALGRCLRHAEDWGAVLLVDERFLLPDNKAYLPKWVKSMWTEPTTYQLKEQLQRFVNKQAPRATKQRMVEPPEDS